MSHLDDEDTYQITVSQETDSVVITQAGANPVAQSDRQFLTVSTDNIPYIPVPGDPGSPGPEGESAYDLWILEGNVGTEQDFLDSLVGPAGPEGPSGNASAAYTHDQAFSQDVWTIVHNLGFRPNIAVFDSAGNEVEGDIAHPDVNTVILTFNAAFGGKAYLS